MENLSKIVEKTCTSTKTERMDFIKRILSKLGYNVISQNYRNDGCNIVAERIGNLPTKIIVSTHYDDYDGNGIGGAYDNGGGVVVLLEVVNQLRNYRPKNTLQFIFFNDEEREQQGSRYFLENLLGEERKNIIYNLNIDGCGVGNLLVNSNQFRKRVAITDTSSFLKYGIPSEHYFTISHRDIIKLKNGKLPILAKKLHTQRDNVEIIEEKSLYHAINSLLGIIKEKDKGGN